MPEAPLDIRRFETTQLVLMFLALVSSFTINRPTLDAFGMGVLFGNYILDNGNCLVEKSG